MSMIDIHPEMFDSCQEAAIEYVQYLRRLREYKLVLRGTDAVMPTHKMGEENEQCSEN
jgi:hypothetical protein